jgi:hypothetical protein
LANEINVTGFTYDDFDETMIFTGSNFNTASTARAIILSERNANVVKITDLSVQNANQASFSFSQLTDTLPNGLYVALVEFDGFIKERYFFSIWNSSVPEIVDVTYISVNEQENFVEVSLDFISFSNAILFVAAYDENDRMLVARRTGGIWGGEATVWFDITPEIHTIRAFVWDGMWAMHPLGNYGVARRNSSGILVWEEI